jgi:CRP/FNR family transcriptional regulator
MPNQNNRERISSCTISNHQGKFFNLLSKSEKELLDANSVTMQYKKREIVFKQGGLVSHVMFVEKGLAKIYIERCDDSLVMMLVPEGNLMGLASLSEEFTTYQFSAMTYIDSSITQIDIKVFRKLILENTAFANEILQKVISDNLQVYGRFFCLTHKQAYGTLADIILCLSERIFKLREFHLPLSRKDMAELTGMSQETVIRILKKFSDDGLIEMDKKRFKVLDYERLSRVSETG